MKLLLALALISLPWLSSDEEGAPSPDEGVAEGYSVSKLQRRIREFRQLGDRFLEGDEPAYARRQQLTRTLGSELSNTKNPVWSNKRELEALFQFVLFGGGSGPLRAALLHEEFPEEWRAFAEGLIAYSDRQLDLARDRLSEFDIARLPASIKAPFMLVKGTLISAKEPASALILFKMVRVMEPGTALEEAALRQEILVLLGKEQLSEALTALTVYLRRFPRTVYWPQFVNVAARAATQLNGEQSKEFIDAIAKIPNSIGAERYREFMLEVVRIHMTMGDFGRARKLAEEIVKVSEANSQAWHRAELYNLTSSVVGDEPEKARERLLALDIDAYSQGERDLVQAALKIADQVRGGYKHKDQDAANQTNQSEDKSYSRREARRKRIESQTIAVPTELKKRIENALTDATSVLSTPER